MTENSTHGISEKRTTWLSLKEIIKQTKKLNRTFLFWKSMGQFLFFDFFAVITFILMACTFSQALKVEITTK